MPQDFEKSALRDRFRNVGAGTVRFIATRQEVLDFISQEIERAREEGYEQCKKDNNLYPYNFVKNGVQEL